MFIQLVAQTAGRRILEAVAIAALSALCTKGIDLAYEEVKERRRACREADAEAAEEPGEA